MVSRPLGTSIRAIAALIANSLSFYTGCSELAKLAEAHCFVIVDRPENFLYVDPLTEFHKRLYHERTS